VIETFPDRMDYNAIDPNLALDEHGRPWLVFGSFWGGIQIVRIDPQTGKLAPGDNRVRPIAARPREKAIEGAFLVRRNGWYWLFASFDQCCRGVASNYKVMVGRSREITGPYIDFHGRPLLEGGGTLVLAGYGTWRGPGHNGILLGDDGDWIVHHMYDAAAGGIATLQVRPLLWGADGWPLAGEPVTTAVATRPAQPPRGVAGIWRHSVNAGAEEYIELRPNGTVNSPVADATWRLDGATLRMRWPDPPAPSGAWIDTCVVAPDAKSFVGRNQKGDLIRALRAAPE
jgi:arabinan endo-1,5-alpha-L-arabinosidase